MIPLVDLKASWAAVEREVLEGFERVFASTSFVLGPEVAAFERDYAAFIGTSACIGVATGTDAIELLVRAAGITGEVLVPTNSFIASALAVSRAGATPRFVDCDDEGLLCLESCHAKLTSKTEVVLPVHLYGQCAPMEKVEVFAREHGALKVIEDAAQAQGARRNNRVAGTWGLGAATSFYPGKNLGAAGDAGAITTNDDGVATRVRALRNYGGATKYVHPETGFNSRLDSLQAVVLSAKLKHLAEGNARRRAAAERYVSLLRNVRDVRLPRVAAGNESVWHLYPIRVPAKARDRVVASMQSAGVAVGVHYPTPIHLQGAFATHAHRVGDFPVAEARAAELISLPMYPELSADQQAHVADALTRALATA